MNKRTFVNFGRALLCGGLVFLSSCSSKTGSGKLQVDLDKNGKLDFVRLEWTLNYERKVKSYPLDYSFIRSPRLRNFSYRKNLYRYSSSFSIEFDDGQEYNLDLTSYESFHFGLTDFNKDEFPDIWLSIRPSENSLKFINDGKKGFYLDSSGAKYNIPFSKH